MIEVSEGYSFRFFIFSLFILIIGIVFLVFANFETKQGTIGIIAFSTSLFFSIIILLEKKGTIIDTDKKRIGRYTEHFTVKTISWTNLEGCEKAILRYEFIDQIMRSRASSTHFRLRLYQLTFIIDSKEIEFHEFPKYKRALEVISVLEKTLKIKTTDKYAEARKKAIQRRKSRR